MTQSSIIRLHANDDVLIATAQLLPGSVIESEKLTVVDLIPPGHKVAVKPIRAGQPVRRYNQIIGFATQPIAAGEHVHTHNLGVGAEGGAFARDYAFGADVKPAPARREATFMGIKRADGRVATRNYIGILFWACMFGIAMKNIGAESTKVFLANTADAVSQIVRWIINLAPFGIMGLVYTNVSGNGLAIFTQYGKLLALLVGTMLFMALIVSPFIMFVYLRCNPYPLVFRCLKESGLTAFFTRSSAANIPVNMSLCEKLGLDKDMYSVSIPLGATINMDGAAITITIMTLAAANTLGIQVSLPAAIVLSAMSALGACGASGVAGGSLLLIPMACSLFGISNDIAMQMVGVGFIIGVVQDSVETALNSAGDVEFAATAEYHQWLKEGKPLPAFLKG